MKGEYADKCRHFNGIQHGKCEAGIVYLSVRDASGGGPYRWPCLSPGGKEPATTTCPQRSLLTQEEHAAWERRIEERWAELEAALVAGKCHVCGADIEPSRIVGRCKYASCGHRLGQVDETEADELRGKP